MTDHTVAQNTQSYKAAVKATESIESPAVGFARPADYKGAISGPAAIIKQNNTQLLLLINIAEELASLKEEVRLLKAQITKTSTPPTVPDDLVEKIKEPIYF